MKAQPEPQNRPWFVYIQGEIFGPLSDDIVYLMLSQNRLQFSDFIWAKTLPLNWVRISEIPLFLSKMPGYPNVPVPSHDGAGETTDPEIPRPAQTLRTAGLTKVAPPPKQKTTQKAHKVRRHPRVGIAARLITADFGTFDVFNISEGGVYLRSSTVVPPLGTSIVFELQVESLSQNLSMSGIVVRRGARGDSPGFAIEFTKMTKEQRDLIRDYVLANPDPTSIPPDASEDS